MKREKLFFSCKYIFMQYEDISEKRKELLMLVLLLIISSYFLFHKLPDEMGDDAVSWSNSAMWINDAHASGRPVLEILQDAINSPGGKTSFSVDAFYITGMATPLWTIVLAAAQKIIGNSAFWTLFLSTFFGFLTIIAVYFTGREFYSKEVGFLSGIVLLSMLLFALISRSGSGFYTLQTFFFVLTVFFFLKAHRDKKKNYLLLSGISIAILFFNGYPTGFIILPVLILYIFVNFVRSFRDPRIFRFSSKNYLLAGTIFVVFFVTLIDLYSLYSNLDSRMVFSSMYETRINSYLGGYIPPDTMESKLKIASRLFTNVFLQEPAADSLNGAHIQLKIIRHPIISPFVSVPFFIGLVCMVKRKNFADILFIGWIGLSLLIFTFFSNSSPRTLFFTTPVIAIIAANGIIYIINWLSLQNNNKWLKKWISFSIVLGIALNAYYIQDEMFNYFYGTMGGNINRFYGMSEAASYINKNSEPEKIEVVLGDRLLTPYDAFYFYTYGKPYSVLYWWDDLLYKKLGGRDNAVNKLYSWETQVLSEKEKIYYLFSVGSRYNEIPGWNLWQQVEWSEFKELHPDLQPVRTIFFPNSIPALQLYEVNRSTPRNNHITIDVQDKSDFIIQSASDGYVNFIKIKGAASNLTILGEIRNFTLPIDILPGMEVSITYNENSRILFEPLFLNKSYKNEIYREENIYLKDNIGWVGLNGTSGYVVYELKSPYQIERLSIRSNPRVFNDIEKRNSVSLYYSTDNKKFVRVYEIKSDGTGNWAVYRDPITGAAFNDGIYERESYNIIRPKSSMVYIMFAFEGSPGEAQLWSPDSQHSLMFDAKMDTSDESKLKLKKGLNRFKVRTGTNATVKLTIAADIDILLINSG
ncbi:Dolichyl-phosphate-mannose-protein mannosyltransferase [uncultured archaeon]|nr:Dolichyl-phosphate-mannose-protein mannosyltransferase [uncultured archaeon]